MSVQAGGIPNLATLGSEREQKQVQLATFILQVTPPAVVLKHDGEKDEIVDDDSYKLRQAACRVLLHHLHEEDTLKIGAEAFRT